jgi:hypothetical protein
VTILSADVLARLDMPAWVGQRSGTFKFVLVNSVLATPPREIHPLRDTTPSIAHDTTRTIKRTLQGFTLGTAESQLINPLSSRILVYMTVGGQDFPLGRYMFADVAGLQSTSGVIINASLYDEMFMVDQQLENAFAPALAPPAHSTGGGMNCDKAMRLLLQDVAITLNIEPTPYVTIGSWPAGTTRGSVLEQIALDGDYFSPWFDNVGQMRAIRSFDPIDEIPTFDLDIGNRVIRDSVVDTNDLITAPNRFIVVSNGTTDDGQAADPIVGRADVATTAPHSIVNRGFVIPSVVERQVNTQNQAGAIARNLAQRQVVYERVELATAPDPRHDSYDVIKWQGAKWLELAWTLPLIEGAAMGHVMRKAYTS